MFRLASIAALGAALVGCSSKTEEPQPGAASGSGSGSGSAHKITAQEAFAQYDKQCVAGDAEACRNLAIMYEAGTATGSADPVRAAALYAQACNRANLSACNSLGLALTDGKGIAQDVAKAQEVWARACDGGVALACSNLGLMLRDGRGVPADLAKAEPILEKACQLKAPLGCTEAGKLDAMAFAKETGDAQKARAKKMLDHYTAGCNADQPPACRLVGVAYLEGTGVPKSVPTAIVWLDRAAAKGDAIALRILGAFAVQGIGVKQDVAKGRELLRRACALKDDEACRALQNVTAGSGSGSGSATRTNH